MKKVVKIDLNDKVYGGRIYENEMVRLLDTDVEFERVFIMKYRLLLFNIFRLIYFYIKYKFFYSGTLLLTNATTFFAGKKTTNMVIVHHIDSPFSFSLNVLYEQMCNKYFLAHPQRYSLVVVVAEFWKQILKQNGFKHVVKIYNSFNADEYQFSGTEIQGFKERFGLLGKPIIYIGNGQKKKGIERCYEKLKDIDAYLVTSGIKNMEIPTTHLNLSFYDYKLLLAAADVVLTMSLFQEGWNRTAHEASLCGTPVVGTGAGGMKELLQMANQTISDFDHLRENVERCMKQKYIPSQALIALNLQYFKECWINVFETIY